MRKRRYLQLGALLLLSVAASCDAADPLGTELLAFRRTDSPSGTTVAVIAYNRIDVSWQDNSPNETGFQVHRALAAAGPFSEIATTAAGATGYADGGLNAVTQYCYKVRAFRTTGKSTTFSAFSNTACGTTLSLPVPAPPSGANAIPSSSNSIALSWTDNSSNENGFRVEFSRNAGTSWQSAGSDLPAGSTTFTHWISAPDQTVCYRIMAFNNFGNSPSSNVDCTAQPIAPNPLSATGVAGPAIDLAWPDLSAVEDGYEVQRAGSDGQWSTVVVLSAGSTGYHDAGITAGIRYTYRVGATKDGGYSDFSYANAMSVTTPPPAPTAISVIPQSSSIIAVNWVGATENVEQFRVERSIDDGGSWLTVGTVYWNEAASYDAVQSEQSYCYRVVAMNSAGESAPSDADCSAAPAAPTWLSVTPVNGGALDLSWNDNSTVEDGYEVRQLIPNCYYYYCYPYYVTLQILPPNTTTFRHSGLDPLSYYIYVVLARKDGGYSDLSPEWVAYPGPLGP